jgi:hypothetical protein
MCSWRIGVARSGVPRRKIRSRERSLSSTATVSCGSAYADRIRRRSASSGHSPIPPGRHSASWRPTIHTTSASTSSSTVTAFCPGCQTAFSTGDTSSPKARRRFWSSGSAGTAATRTARRKCCRNGTRAGFSTARVRAARSVQSG